jgi:hypothetical protein
MGARRRSPEKTLGWVLLEVLAALGIAVAIVWWTFPRKPKDGDKER